MIRNACFFVVSSTLLVAQSSDSATLQALLQEVRQLRQDLNGMTVVAQRAQILLYRVQLQDDVTKKATQRYDQASAKVRDAELKRAAAVNDLKTAEENLTAARMQSERDGRENQVREMKRRVEMWSSDESAHRATEATAATDLRNEQAKLFELQQRLDTVERQLEKSSPAPALK